MDDNSDQINPNFVNTYEDNDGKTYANYANYYNYYNYYQHFAVGNTTQTNNKERTIELINKALAKQQLKSSNDVKDDDEEEGQIPASPAIFNRSPLSSPEERAEDCSPNSPFNTNTSQRSVSRSHSREGSVRSQSRSRKRQMSRSRSPSTSRRRRRSRSRSPYFGPIIKDYRRGRRGFVRYPRGFRDRGNRHFRRGGHHSNYSHSNYYPRRQEYSRSKSRSFSPKTRSGDKSVDNSDDEKTMDSKHSEILKPSNINISEKRLTQSFLAMLEEKQKRAKMIPIQRNTDTSDADLNRRHGFVNTFNSVSKQESRKHTLNYDLEKEGWQVIDDANTDSRINANKSTEKDYYDDNRTHSESINFGNEKVFDKTKKSESDSSEEQNKSKRKKSKKQKKKKKRRVTTSESSESDSDNDNEEEVETKSKKRSKKKKKKSKKRRKKVSSSSSSSENEEQSKRHKKKRKKRDSSSESENEEKSEDIINSATNQQNVGTNDLEENISLLDNEMVNEITKSKDKKKSKRKSSSDSSDSDSDLENKKKKKKKRKKTSKKRKHRSSSSSSSDSSDSSESGDRKKRKKKKSKKSKSKKHKKKEKREKTKSIVEEKKIKEEVEESEFVSVLSLGEPPLELKWPKKLIKHTFCMPSLQYSINPKVTPNSDDFRNDTQIPYISEFGDTHKSESTVGNDSHELSSEYERFIGELNPVSQSDEKFHSMDVEVRDNLVKQSYDKNESQSADIMTSSERRVFERNKKQTFHSYDNKNENKRHDDLKSAPMSAYYSAKVSKSSPNKNAVKTESKSHRTHENDYNNKTNFKTEEHKEESSHKQNSNSGSKSVDKKITARGLLEKVKRKHNDSKETKEGKDCKESLNKEKSENKVSKKLPQTGKLKILSKKSKKSVTTANADSTQNAFVSQPMALDMHYDYQWYYNYYLNSVYGVGQYPQMNDPSLGSAYFAQYSMLTSYDYNQTDLNNWITQRGYTLDENSSNNQTDVKTVKNEETNEKSVTEEIQPSDESLDLQTNQTKDANQQNVEIKPESVRQSIQPSDDLKTETKQNCDQKIEVLVSTNYSGEPPLETIDELKISENTGSHNTNTDSNDKIIVSSPPPPPPPSRPTITTLTSTEPITLPNGEVLPAGTKQLVVHPYQMEDSHKFTADWFCEAYNSQNKTQTNS